MELFPRLLESELETALSTHGIVLLEGPRACGKTTLLQLARDAGLLTTIVDLADPAVRRTAADDPLGFAESLPPFTGIDEAQLVPDLALAVKRCVDRPQGWGPAILTGSAPVARNELGGTPPLAGRATRRSLTTLTEREKRGHATPILGLLTSAGTRHKLQVERLDKPAYMAIARASGFPAARNLDQAALTDWIGDNYVAGVLPTMLRDNNRRVRGANLERVLRFLAASTSTELNVAHLTRHLDLNRETATNHVQLLEDLHLLHTIPGWRTNAAKRSISRPKVHAADGGLAHWAIGSQPTDQQRGALIESLVFRELYAQLQATRRRWQLHHWRDRDTEVDFVLVDGDQALLLEVKSARSITSAATRGLDAFERAHPQLNCEGIVLYLGDEIVPLGTNHAAVPVSALWATPDGYSLTEPLEP